MTFNLTIEQRKKGFAKLGEFLLSEDARLHQLIQTAHFYNSWFTPAETLKAVKNWGAALNTQELDTRLPSSFSTAANKQVGLILAGNIPLVGFHDILCVLAAGSVALIKQSSQDKLLLPYILEKLIEIEPGFTNQIRFVERLQSFDAVIATGSNNTSRYFDYYFGKVPHIIRKNRNSIAVLSGTETKEELSNLGKDIFDYYGLGCRNVSKLYVPAHYNFTAFFEAIESYKYVADNHKYQNNYDYNKSVYLVNGDKHLDNGFLLVKEDERMASPLAVLYFQYYQQLSEVEEYVNSHEEQIQVLAAHVAMHTSIIPQVFGESQHPKLWDYADRVNVLEFLGEL